MCRYAYIMAFTDMVIRRTKLFQNERKRERERGLSQPNTENSRKTMSKKKKKKVEKRYKKMYPLDLNWRYVHFLVLAAGCVVSFFSFLFTDITIKCNNNQIFFPFNAFNNNKRRGKKTNGDFFIFLFFFSLLFAISLVRSYSSFVRFCLNRKRVCSFTY